MFQLLGINFEKYNRYHQIKLPHCGSRAFESNVNGLEHEFEVEIAVQIFHELTGWPCFQPFARECYCINYTLP
jgi:hypothetical protein